MAKEEKKVVNLAPNLEERKKEFLVKYSALCKEMKLQLIAYPQLYQNSDNGRFELVGGMDIVEMK